MSKSQTAVAVVGYNRPEYFQPTIASLFANQALSDCDLWMFLDGGRDNRQRDYQRLIDEELPRANQPRRIEVVARREGYGCGRNLIDARRTLFDEYSYERVFVFEDDMVLGEHYLELTMRLLDWVEERYSDIGVVQAYDSCALSCDEKVRRLDEVDVGNPHWWGYLMPRTTWNRVRGTLYEYETKFLLGKSYSQRDSPSIRKWAREKLSQHIEKLDTPSDIRLGDKLFPRSWDFQRYFRQEFATGQDSITVLGMTLAGLQKLKTTVNRSQPIGAKGLHSTETHFRRTGLDRISLDAFESDQYRCQFRVRGQFESALHPRMRADEVEAFRRWLRTIQPSRVLEIGAGGSTTLFAREFGGSWWSIEHSHEWLDQVARDVTAVGAKNVRLLHCPEKQIVATLDEVLPVQFDLFIVDGFDRCAVLDRLREHLGRHDGSVLLHDASRKRYREAVNRFPIRRTLTAGDGKHQGIVLLENQKQSSHSGP